MMVRMPDKLDEYEQSWFEPTMSDNKQATEDWQPALPDSEIVLANRKLIIIIS